MSLKYVLIVTAITALMGGIVIFKHRGNIVRIMNGNEKNYLEIKKKFKYEKNIQCLALDVFISE